MINRYQSLIDFYLNIVKFPLFLRNPFGFKKNIHTKFSMDIFFGQGGKFITSISIKQNRRELVFKFN